jgi:hypothetical protein
MMIDNYTVTQLTGIGMKHYYATERNRHEKIHNLEYLSGLTIDELVVLFAAGYTLEPPKLDRDIREAENNKMYEEITIPSKERIKRLTEILENTNRNSTTKFDKKGD